MGYAWSLETAGAKIVDFKNFGSYQGDWWALVMYKGEYGWVHGYFGSCSGCDAFEAEFDWWWDDYEENDPKLLKRLAEFGESYLDALLTQEEAEKIAGKECDWDLEADDMLEWIQQFRGLVLIPINL